MLNMKKIINSVYKTLLSIYGKQGWWPIIEVAAGKSVYSERKELKNIERFEIIIGALLTQNTTWKNAEKALLAIKENRLLAPQKLQDINIDILANLIRSSGYYNQKARKIHDFLSWFKKYYFSFDILMNMSINEIRSELLTVRGIGSETADSIILYALQKKIFVVDAYTIRIFSRVGVFSGSEKYDKVQEIFHKNFTRKTEGYNQYHALIVKHAKEICIPVSGKRMMPLCDKCCVNFLCKKLIS